MNKWQEKKYSKMFTWHSPSVASLNIKKVPEYVKKDIPTDIYELALKSPILDTTQGFLLLNEDFDQFEMRKNILVALDWIPRSLLLDIYDMERERYKDIDPDNPEQFGNEKERIRYAYSPLIKSLLDAQDPEKHI